MQLEYKTKLKLTMFNVQLEVPFVISVDSRDAPPLVLGIPGMKQFQLIYDPSVDTLISRLNERQFMNYMNELLLTKSSAKVNKTVTSQSISNQLSQRNNNMQFVETEPEDAGHLELEPLSQNSRADCTLVHPSVSAESMMLTSTEPCLFPVERQEGVTTSVNPAERPEQSQTISQTADAQLQSSAQKFAKSSPPIGDSANIDSSLIKQKVSSRLHPDLLYLKNKFEQQQLTSSLMTISSQQPTKLPFFYDPEASSNLVSKLEQVLDNHRTVFCEQLEDLRPSRMKPVAIKLKPGAEPCCAHPYRSVCEADLILRKLLEPLLRNGVVRTSRSPWRSNSFLVDRKLPENLDNTINRGELNLKRYRMVHDMREVNKKIENDSYLLPRIDQLKEKVLGARFFSKLDARSGYLQLRLTEDSIPLTSVWVAGQQVEYTTLVFGIKVAPALYQRAFSELFDDFINGDEPFVYQYLDDTLIFSKTEAAHIQHVQQVFDRLQKFDVQLNREKCLFGSSTVNYLGHRIGADNVYIDPDRVKPILDMPPPKDKTTLRSFLGAINQFKDFCPNLRAMLKPLDVMTSPKPDVKVVWTDSTLQVFQQAKELLTTAPILAVYDNSKPHVLVSDASDYALGGALLQIDIHPETGKEIRRVVEYHSRAFNSAERNYMTVEKELLAIIALLKHWRPYLAFHHFTIESDSHAICIASRLGRTRQTIPDHQRLARWGWTLQDFDYTIKHVKGKNHNLADCLSRCIFPKVDLKSLIDQEIQLTGQNPFTSIFQPSFQSYQPLQYLMALSFNDSLEKLQDAQRADPWIARMIDDLVAHPEQVSKKDKINHSKLIIVDGLLCNQIRKKLFKFEDPPAATNSAESEEPQQPALEPEEENSEEKFFFQTFTRIVIPETYIFQVLELAHDSPVGGHFGVKRTCDRVSIQFYWPGWAQDVADYVRSCETCQRRNPKNKAEGIYQSQTASLPDQVIEPLHFIVMDQIQLPSIRAKGYSNLLIAMDLTSKFMFLRAVKHLSANEVIAFVKHEIMPLGRPAKIVTDNAKYFVAKSVTEFCKKENIQLSHGVPHYPQCQALAERNVATVKTNISKFIQDNTDWLSHLDDIVISYNTSIHSATQLSPFYLVTGRHYLQPSLGEIQLPLYAQPETCSETPEEFRARMRKVWQQALKTNNKFNDRNLDRMNATRTPLKLEIGMKVLRRVSPDKLGPGIETMLYSDGPYQITRMFGPTSFEAVHIITGNLIKSNAHQVKRYHLRAEIPRLQLLKQKQLAKVDARINLHDIISETLSTISDISADPNSSSSHPACSQLYASFSSRIACSHPLQIAPLQKCPVESKQSANSRVRLAANAIHLKGGGVKSQISSSFGLSASSPSRSIPSLSLLASDRQITLAEPTNCSSSMSGLSSKPMSAFKRLRAAFLKKALAHVAEEREATATKMVADGVFEEFLALPAALTIPGYRPVETLSYLSKESLDKAWDAAVAEVKWNPEKDFEVIAKHRFCVSCFQLVAKESHHHCVGDLVLNDEGRALRIYQLRREKREAELKIRQLGGNPSFNVFVNPQGNEIKWELTALGRGLLAKFNSKRAEEITEADLQELQSLSTMNVKLVNGPLPVKMNMSQRLLQFIAPEAAAHVYDYFVANSTQDVPLHVPDLRAVLRTTDANTITLLQSAYYIHPVEDLDISEHGGFEDLQQKAPPLRAILPFSGSFVSGTLFLSSTPTYLALNPSPHSFKIWLAFAPPLSSSPEADTKDLFDHDVMPSADQQVHPDDLKERTKSFAFCQVSTLHHGSGRRTVMASADLAILLRASNTAAQLALKAAQLVLMAPNQILEPGTVGSPAFMWMHSDTKTITAFKFQHGHYNCNPPRSKATYRHDPCYIFSSVNRTHLNAFFQLVTKESSNSKLAYLLSFLLQSSQPVASTVKLAELFLLHNKKDVHVKVGDLLKQLMLPNGILYSARYYGKNDFHGIVPRSLSKPFLTVFTVLARFMISAGTHANSNQTDIDIFNVQIANFLNTERCQRFVEADQTMAQRLNFLPTFPSLTGKKHFRSQHLINAANKIVDMDDTLGQIEKNILNSLVKRVFQDPKMPAAMKSNFFRLVNKLPRATALTAAATRKYQPITLRATRCGWTETRSTPTTSLAAQVKTHGHHSPQLWQCRWQLRTVARNEIMILWNHNHSNQFKMTRFKLFSLFDLIFQNLCN